MNSWTALSPETVLSVRSNARTVGTVETTPTPIRNRQLHEESKMSLQRLQRRSCAIAPDAQKWVLDLSNHTPKQFGYASDEWSVTLLAFHARRYCRDAGHPSLAGLTYRTLSNLLACGPSLVIAGE
jgi:hypothetical protein